MGGFQRRKWRKKYSHLQDGILFWWSIVLMVFFSFFFFVFCFLICFVFFLFSFLFWFFFSFLWSVCLMYFHLIEFCSYWQLSFTSPQRSQGVSVKCPAAIPVPYRSTWRGSRAKAWNSACWTASVFTCSSERPRGPGSTPRWRRSTTIHTGCRCLRSCMPPRRSMSPSIGANSSTWSCRLLRDSRRRTRSSATLTTFYARTDRIRRWCGCSDCGISPECAWLVAQPSGKLPFFIFSHDLSHPVD